MATVQVTDGSSAVTSTSTKNNGGTVVNAGNADTTKGPISRALQLNTLADDVGAAPGSKVVSNDGTGSQYTDRSGLTKAVSAGTLAFNANSSQWIMSGGNVTTTVGGVSNTVLASAGADFNGKLNIDINSTNGTVSDRKVGTTPIINILAVPSSGINSFRTKGAGAGNINTYINPLDGTDAVASETLPSRSIPGELTYNFGGLNGPTTSQYKAKNSYES
jgi:hypothetical protein